MEQDAINNMEGLTFSGMAGSQEALCLHRNASWQICPEPGQHCIPTQKHGKYTGELTVYPVGIRGIKSIVCSFILVVKPCQLLPPKNGTYPCILDQAIFSPFFKSQLKTCLFTLAFGFLWMVNIWSFFCILLRVLGAVYCFLALCNVGHI